MRELKDVTAPAEFKADMATRRIEGYAARFGNVDSVGDIIERGAFAKTIQERRPFIKVLFNHDERNLIGKPEDMREDGTGLWTLSYISDIPEGNKVLQLVADGVLTHMSFAYDVVRRDFLQQEGGTSIRRLLELKLWEFGPVAFPANEQAEILGLKELSDSLADLKAKVPDLRALLAKRGYLKDSEIDLVTLLGPAITKAVTDAINALAAHEPERSEAKAEGASHHSAEQAAPTPAVVDPEEKLYLGQIREHLNTLHVRTAAATIRAAAR